MPQPCWSAHVHCNADSAYSVSLSEWCRTAGRLHDLTNSVSTDVQINQYWHVRRWTCTCCIGQQNTAQFRWTLLSRRPPTTASAPRSCHIPALQPAAHSTCTIKEYHSYNSGNTEHASCHQQGTRAVKFCPTKILHLLSWQGCQLTQVDCIMALKQLLSFTSYIHCVSKNVPLLLLQ